MWPHLDLFLKGYFKPPLLIREEIKKKVSRDALNQRFLSLVRDLKFSKPATSR